MTGRYLLDTNIVAAFLNGDPAIRDKILQSDGVAVPSIVMGELYFGAAKSANAAVNLARLNHYADDFQIVPVDADTAREYGQIRHRLKSIGKPIPLHDIWIAAIARQHQFTLVTRDAHFQSVEGIVLEAW